MVEMAIDPPLIYGAGSEDDRIWKLEKKQRAAEAMHESWVTAGVVLGLVLTLSVYAYAAYCLATHGAGG